MLLETMVSGPLENNVYLIADEKKKQAILIDAAKGCFERVSRILKQNNLGLGYLINTHGHFDHTTENALFQKLGAKICVHKLDAHGLASPHPFKYPLFSSSKADVLLEEGSEVKAGEITLTVLHTPGHSAGCISLYSKEHAIVFTGDTLFAAGPGRMDFADSSVEAMRHSLERLLSLPKETRVLPGHGPETTIGEEAGWMKDFVKGKFRV